MSRILYRLLVSLARLGRSKNLEIIVLRQQPAVLHRQTDRLALADEDRTLLGAIAAALPRPQRVGWLVTPDTLLRWHQRPSPATGPNPPDQQAARPPPPRTANSCSRRPARTRHGATAASPANSLDSASGSKHRQRGESSNSTTDQKLPKPCDNRTLDQQGSYGLAGYSAGQGKHQRSDLDKRAASQRVVEI